MKPTLLVGLGNPLAGDDGVGWHLADRLRSEPRLPHHVEVIQATDLLRLQDTIADRPWLILLDALLDDGPPGRIVTLDALDALEEQGASVHHLPPAQALGTLRAIDPAIRQVPVTFVGVTVTAATVGSDLSPTLQGRLDAAVSAVLEVVRRRRPQRQ